MELHLSELLDVINRDSTKKPRIPIGIKICIRTITYHYCGIVHDVDDHYVELRSASWLADSGRWSEFVKTGEGNEVEMYANNVHVALQSVIDWTEMTKIPEQTK